MMRKIIYLFTTVLLYITVTFAQAEVDIEILVYDNAGFSYPLWFGLDLTATDGLDPALSESDLPPPPPANAFDARWWIPPFDGSLSSWRDYRAPGDPPAFPFTGSKDYVIKIQSTDFPITITWDLPSEIDTSSRIGDPFGISEMSFSGRDSMIVTNPAIPQVNVTIEYNAMSPVGVESDEKGIPDDYQLFQNYPNPFNPATNIKFQIPEASNVSLKIYNLIGQEIKTLINDEVSAGSYYAIWDGTNDLGEKMSSGIYIYRLVTEDFVQAKQMILLK